MTAPSALHRPTGVPLSRRLPAELAVALAGVIAVLPPRRIREVLVALRRGCPPARYQQAKLAREAVCAVSLRCASPGGCLPRSLATALLCRMSGTWPTWCSGVRVAAPFGAHAWVEAGGKLVEEGVPDDYFRRVIIVAADEPEG